MELQRVRVLPSGPDWLYEIKWDGFRCIARKDGARVELRSRNNKSLTGRFPEVVTALRSLASSTLLLDGEIVALDEGGRPSFASLQRSSSGHTLVYYAFDLLYQDGVSLLDQALSTRRARLAAMIQGTSVRFSAELPGRPAQIIKLVQRHGLEGVVGKRRSSCYVPGGRSGSWVKLRLGLSQDFIVAGYVPSGKGLEAVIVSYHDDIGRLTLAGSIRAGLRMFARPLREILEQLRQESSPLGPITPSRSSWGGGPSAAQLRAVKWVRPTVVVRVRFAEWPRAGLLRHAELEGIRRDVSAADVGRESGSD